MKILGIETSCDETAAAIVKNGRKTLANIVASSKELHKKTGGIIPEIAAREQLKCIIPILKETLKQGNITSIDKIDAIAVTVGPGLIGSLLVGVETAKTIAYINKKPIIPVNHIHAHIYANWVGIHKFPKFPAIALVVSGGHTELFFLKDIKKISWISGTRDDAAGEAFDKTARIIGLTFPGGPVIAAEAAKFHISTSKFQIEEKLPRPMIYKNNFDFSFSGLKTAVNRKVEELKKQKLWGKVTRRYLAYEIQEAITDVLVSKTLKAARRYKVKSILLGGGVAANQRLKEKFKLQITNYKLPVILHVPPPYLCTDNAVYIASFAYYNYYPVSWKKIQAKPNLPVEV